MPPSILGRSWPRIDRPMRLVATARELTTNVPAMASRPALALGFDLHAVGVGLPGAKDVAQ